MCRPGGHLRLSLLRRPTSDEAPGTTETPALEVGGFVPFSSTDWPGKLAAVVFVQGCPWRCAYCHNTSLQPKRRGDGMAWGEVVEVLGRRVGLLDAVVFSGGEPTLDAGLPAAISTVRAMGFQVGLHTAGLDPARLKALLPLVDWVGLDVKTSFTDYAEVTGVARSGTAAKRSLAHVLASGVAYEVRTTYHPALLGDAALIDLARGLEAAGARDWVLQQWHEQDEAANESRAAHAAAGDAPVPLLAATWRWPPAALLDTLREVGPALSLR
ncbi:MAG: anaerobic ribonucleoside-triphosphate reductase activating protein [Burkholderiales bacterium]|nr:anaerobic ribonucleoside-triphosphate reductase activating protein [Burkholderiales bacterium]